MTDPAVFAAIALVSGVASVVQQATGFGFALMATPLLTLVIDAHTAVLVALLVGFLGTAGQAVEGRRDCVWPVAGRMLAGAAVGLLGGLIIFRAADPDSLQILIGLVVLAAVAALAAGFDLRHAGHRWDYGAGALSGALTTSVGTNGPPLVFALAARQFSPESFRATLTTVFALLDVLSIGAFVALGAITEPIVLAAAAAVPAVVAGGVAGIRVRRLLSPSRFRAATLGLLATAGLVALVSPLVA